ncbi:T9SS type A sorting domain-containing protein [Polaribacter porphyrae]|uniref:Secretion system C-terminal sorting domain-containing protein n=1 Tax=Polaribacter porphyrae TaxID=1137780 RepID=A0A2S7WQW7_9FLAO|nr:T9SS type A sorting domain-containing protein [Polaribacter porphyrae]PQJ80008.1 hypothetical protein BTO18_12875 [Polaribacter porphyrae]
MIKKLLLTGILFLSFSLTAQVTKLKEINDSGTSSSSPANLFVFDGKLYFAADDSSGSNSPGNADLGKELWVTDGTENGTVLLKDLRTGSSSSSPAFFFEYKGKMYFSANETGAGNVLFSSDGTAANTTATGDGFIFNSILFNDIIYYINTSDSNGLYQFDGTTAMRVAGTGAENILGANYTLFNGKFYLYMSLTSDNTNSLTDQTAAQNNVGLELYSFDPGTGNFQLIKDINPGATLESGSNPTDYDPNNSGISNFTVIGNELYFEAMDKLWKTDGTENGTVAIAAADILKGTRELFAFDGKILFEGDVADDSNGDSGGDNLFVYNPTTDALTNITNFTGNSQNHDPSDYAIYDGYVYYRGEEATTTSGHLYRTDGVTTQLITNTIKDIDEVVVYNNKLYFEGDDGTTGNELYTLDPATLSIEKVNFDGVSIYPNPSKNTINISHNLSSKIAFDISDLSGRSVLKGDLVDNTIKHSLNSGVYLLKLSSETITKTQKIVVE